jgi:ParB family chromosome partitioning protein
MGKTAFDAARFSGFNFDPDDLYVIGIDTEDGSEHHLWDERILLPLDESMVLSIMSIGVKETITVQKIGEDPCVADGRRRVLHAREANKRLKKQGEPLVKVPALVERGSDEHMTHVSIALNEIRREDDILTKAAKCSRMLDRNGGDTAEAAIAFGVTQTTIANWRKLVELPAPVKKAVSDGVMSANAASKLHGLERDEQLTQLEEAKKQHTSTGKKTTGRQVNKKNGKKHLKPTKKELMGFVNTLSHNNDPFAAGVAAGMQYAMGEKRPDVEKFLK